MLCSRNNLNLQENLFKKKKKEGKKERKECNSYADSAFCVILISGWENEPRKQQVQREVNNFAVRQTACDTTEHVA